MGHFKLTLTIVLSNNFPISLRDMNVYDLEISNFPLVVLNGCHTGNIDPLYVSNLVSTFLEKGARGVIATECSVPDHLAAEFTKRLYRYLLDGKELGTCVMSTRHLLFKKYKNPVGLLYALYAPPNFRLSGE